MDSKMYYFLSSKDLDFGSNIKIWNEYKITKMDREQTKFGILMNTLLSKNNTYDEYYEYNIFSEGNYQRFCQEFDKMSAINLAIKLYRGERPEILENDLKRIYAYASDIFLKASMICEMKDIGFEAYHTEDVDIIKKMFGEIITYYHFTSAKKRNNRSEENRIKKLLEFTDKGKIIINCGGYGGGETFEIDFNNKPLKIKRDGFLAYDGHDCVYEIASEKELKILHYLIYSLKTKGEYESPIMCLATDQHTLSIDMELNNKIIHKCEAYSEFPEDMEVLYDYVKFLTSTKEDKESLIDEINEYRKRTIL